MIEIVVNKSKRILLPGGRDYEHCVHVFKQAFQIEVPAFAERSLVAEDAGGRRFVKVKSRDIPMLIQRGFADTGIAYTDICEEKITPKDSIAYEKIGDARLKLCLLFPLHKKDKLEKRLNSEIDKPLTVATAYPNVLRNYIKSEKRAGRHVNMEVSSLVPSGSVEAMVALGVADIVADVVNTGITAKANELEPLHLTDVFPAIVYRK